MANPLLLLAGAIGFEVAATLSLRAASGFTKLGPSVVVVIGYAASFTLLGLALKAGLNLGVGYAIWSGVGTSLVALASVLLFQEKLTAIGLVGIAMIVIGVVVLHLGGAAHESPSASPAVEEAR